MPKSVRCSRQALEHCGVWRLEGGRPGTCRVPFGLPAQAHASRLTRAARRCATPPLPPPSSAQVHETQAFWALPTASVQRVDYQHLDREPEDVLLTIAPRPAGEPLVKVRLR